MNKSKVDFISDLLTHKDIGVNEKERLFLLTKNELCKLHDEENENVKRIEERINNLEKEINITTNSAIVEQQTKDYETKPKEEKYIKPLPKPQETKSFLSLFNNSEGIKYLTHKFNSDKPEHEDFINLCKREFEESKNKYPNIPKKLLRRVEEFAFSKTPDWFIRKGKEKDTINMGWCEPSFVEWYKKPINTHPGLDAKWNESMIIPFKESIEVRAGNLIKIVNQSLDDALGESKDNFNIQFDESALKTAEFYTDVDLFQQTLFNIFSMIKDRSRNNLNFDISVDYENETLHGGILKKVIITHIASEATKRSNDPEFAKGDFKSILSNMWGLCNYEIQAKFPDGYYKRIFLTDNLTEYTEYVSLPKAILIKNASKVAGFTHILKFYYIKSNKYFRLNYIPF